MSATIGTILNLAGRQLAGASASPRLDAEVLLAHVLETSRSQMLTRSEHVVPDDSLRLFAALVLARCKGRPVAYLTGLREFWSLPLKITADALIPRPDTELLVEEVLQLIPADAGWYIADLGTGSGAVALALAKERPDCRFVATDLCPRALNVARENARNLDLRNVEFLEGEWFAPLAGRRFGMIVSNPPYVPDGDPHLAQGDLRFEPRLALAGGPDGLAAIRKIALRAPAHLEPGGWFLVEHGYDQGERVRTILTAAGFGAIRTARDLAGHERVSLGRFEA